MKQQKKQENKSIAAIIKAWWANLAKDREDKKKLARKQLIEAQLTAQRQKEYYRIKANRYIEEARDAIKRSDNAGRVRAAQLLKVSYGAYRYMCSLSDTYTAISTNLDIREMTSEFARTINEITAIKVGDEHVNFAALTRKALRHLKPADLENVDGMFDELIRGSISATEATNANDVFLDALINGTATLDTPYPSPTIAELDKTEDAKMQDEQLLAILDQTAGTLTKH